MLQTKPEIADRQVRNERLQRAILRILKDHVGAENAITLKEIRLKYWDTGTMITERSLRQAINELRNQGEPICSIGGVGHWWPANIDEVFESVEVELRSKARNLLITSRKMRQAAINMFGGQRSLL